ncbi:MAG: glycine cleavage system protein H [Candidatus Altiarchaeota archaeon]|nr:glycine cleavage system protein H [Candidatus Altiarchaeota archaeon]
MKLEEFDYPDGLKYIPGHVWAKIDGDKARIGLTGFGSSLAKEIVHIDLPENGEEFELMRSIASYETIKSVSQVPAPFRCRITAVNEKLLDNPSLINTDPYGDGWIAEIEILDAKESRLMDSKEAVEYYGKILKKEKERYGGIYD